MLASLLALTVAFAPIRPNVVLIFADDLGYREVGAYGQKKIPTPNIERLAREGMRFDRFYSASPVCAPSRCSLLTGKNTGRAVIRGNSEVGGWELNTGEGQFPLPASEFTIAEGFKKAGYATACIGKWGLGGPATEGHPNRQGFDYFFGYLCQRQAHNYYPTYLWENSFVYQLTENRYFRPSAKLAASEATDEVFAQFIGKQYAPYIMEEKALAWLKKQRSNPFFLYYPSPLPHTALQAPESEVAAFPTEWDMKPYLGENGYVPSKRPRATYAAMIASLDRSVGRILDTLKAEGLDKNTLVLFTSDNGTTFLGQVDREFFGSVGELRGTKSTCYEGGIRVPFMARWPGHVGPGTVSSQVMYAPDLMPTLASLAGFKPPSHDGRDLGSVLFGGPKIARKELYFEFPEGAAYQAAIFDDKWKAIIPGLASGKSAVQIFDLEDDPSESKDLGAKRPDLVERARAYFAREHHVSKDFPLPGVDKK